MKVLRRLAVLLTIVQLSACGQGGKAGQNHGVVKKTSPPPPFSETVLSAYKKDAMGGFTPNWVAYIVEPQKGAADQSSYVEVNGNRLGPYSQVSGRMEASGNGKHLAFAAEKGQKWVVVVDGVEKYTHDGLLFPWSAWSPSLEGNSYIPQTQAAALEFSPSGEMLAYPAKNAAGSYAVFVNGKPGPSYTTVGTDISFIGDQVMYYAVRQDKKLMEIVGGQVLGPYDESYSPKISADGKHYLFWGKKGGKPVMVVDGQERELLGDPSDYVIGNGGSFAYAYKASGKYHIHAGDADLPGDYEEVQEVTLSPDGKKVAFWGLRDGKWNLQAGDKTFPGFGGYFVYLAGGNRYSVMWSPDSQHVAYYVRDGGGLVLDGEKLKDEYKPPGLALQVIVDDQGRPVGSGLMQGPSVKGSDLVQAVLTRDTLHCDPFSVSLVGNAVSCIEKKDGNSYMHVGDKEEGPYRSITTILYKSAQDKHYAYVAVTEKGQQFVVDGAVSTHVYEGIYRLAFNEENGSIEYLALKDGKLLRVVEPIQGK